MRIHFQTQMPTMRFKFGIPLKMQNEIVISWALAFARQIRGLSFDGQHQDLTELAVNEAWEEFLLGLKYGQSIYNKDNFQ